MIQVSTISELKTAMQSGADEIVTFDSDLVSKLKAVQVAKTWGPIAIAGIIAAIPLVSATGGVGAVAVYAVAPAATTTSTAIIALVVAIGGVIAISLFTDWDSVELKGPAGVGMKLKRKQK